MIINSIGSAFSGNSGSSQGANGSSNQSDAAPEDTSASGSDQTDATQASGSTGSSNTASGSSGTQAGAQSAASNSSSRAAAAENGTGTQSATLIDDTPKAPTDINALRREALEVQKRLNTEMLIKSLGAAPETDLSLLGDAESEPAVPLAVAAYAENFAPSATETGKTAA